MPFPVPLKGRKARLLLLMVLLAGQAGATQAQVRLPAGRGLVELEAKPQRREGDVFFAEGDVDIRYQDARLRADQVAYYSLTSVAIARGHIQFDRQNQHLEADEATYNMRTGRGKFARVRSEIR